MKYEYSVVGKRLELEVPDQVNIGTEAKEFLSPKSVGDNTPADFVARFIISDELPQPYGDAYAVEDRLYQLTPQGMRMFIIDPPSGIVFAVTDWNYKTGSIEARVSPRAKRIPEGSTGLLTLISFETLVFASGAAILHSSFIRIDGRGILFSAPSGTGKSTQAELWSRYRGAEILNGDRSGLIKENGIWTAYGLPIAGSSQIFRNEKAPIAAIVHLKQGTKNEIRRLNMMEAIRALYPELTVHRWDRRFAGAGLNLLLDMAPAVPIYELSCLPDEGAVELLSKTIEENYNKE